MIKGRKAEMRGEANIFVWGMITWIMCEVRARRDDGGEVSLLLVNK